MSPTCKYGKCDGAGKISYVHSEPDDTERDLGGGLVGGPITTHGTLLCRCRAELEPREGEASWWTSERIFRGYVQGSIFQEGFEVEVETEVPINEDGYKVVMRGNRFYPTLIDVHIDFKDKTTLFPEEARKLAKLLTDAADKADAVDQPCVDACGHWSPCECAAVGVNTP